MYLCTLMKKLKILILVVFCLLTACQMSETAPRDTVAGTDSDSALILQDRAYQEMFSGSLAKAEAFAYRAFLMSRDTTLERNALALLCYIYYREGKQEDLQLLVQTVSPEMYVSVMDVQSQVEQAKASRQQMVYATAVVVLLLLLATLAFWYVHRTRSLARLYQHRITTVKQEMKEELQRLSAVVPPEETGGEDRPQYQIGETKTAIDTLFAIVNDQNISQLGKREEQAVLKILPMVDSVLADALGKATLTLTPKETFFCIMEYYGKTDQQKARSFCCSEQAIRSTKSRLGKKMNISVLRSE